MSQICVYFQSWSSGWAADVSGLDLARVDGGITILNIAFVLPKCTYYPGQRNWDGTGLQFSSDFGVVVGGIARLRDKGMKVMLSVGGGSYWSSSTYEFQPANCIALMQDLGCDGIDLDWEVGADHDGQLCYAIEQLKRLMPAGKKISFCGWSTGAMDKVVGDQFRGMNVSALVQQGGNVDWVNVMAYDAGPSFDPKAALMQYRKYYKGPLSLGFEVGTQAWGGAMLTRDQVISTCDFVMGEDVRNGVFVWALQKESGGTPSTMDIVTIAREKFKVGSPPAAGLVCPNCKHGLALVLK